MTFLNYIFSPKLYKEYGTQKTYEPGSLEKCGDQIISTLSMFWNFGYYTSPLVMTFLYRRGYFVIESITTLAKFTTGVGIILAISLCMRGLGRSQTETYARFHRIFSNAKISPKDEEAKKQLRAFDFSFEDWPVDFDASTTGGDDKKKSGDDENKSGRKKPFWAASLPCEVAAYLAIHTFGIRMIYPGSVKLIQSYLQPMLLDGRTKLIEEEKGVRYKLRSRDNNVVDTLFVDNRENGTSGRTLVICSEGNAGFYEIGIMVTPLELKHSVLGWNHPGFGGSTGLPYPDQDQNAIDTVMQFAIHKLGFLPENIVVFGWSIGAYSSLYLASQYPEIRAVVIDATFDDILPLAIPKMPQSLSGIVKLAIRNYINLNNSELITKFNGPVLMIRRTEDEIITVDELNLSTNRGNFLLLDMLKHRFPNIFKAEQIIFVNKLLAKPLDPSLTSTETNELCYSLLMSYVSDNEKSYPMEIGADYNDGQRNQMAEYLVRKHLLDFKSSHCTPLPIQYFQAPWEIVDETDFVFT